MIEPLLTDEEIRAIGPRAFPEVRDFRLICTNLERFVAQAQYKKTIKWVLELIKKNKNELVMPEMIILALIEQLREELKEQ